MQWFRLITWIALMAVAALYPTTAAAQRTDPCPGFKNPTSFCTNDPEYYWTARVGERVYTAGNINDTTTGYHVMSTCTNAPDIPCGNITSPEYNSSSSGMLNTCEMYGINTLGFDASRKRFQIITEENAGLDVFTVRGEGTGMPRIPPGYETSIRLGDMCNNGNATQNPLYSATSENKGAEALFYTMFVTSENALLLINYAVVARRYPHTAYDAGEFLIRVVAQNEDGTWSNEPLNDSLWYKVSAPQFSNIYMPIGWLAGAGEPYMGDCTYAYKPWAKVAISLNDYLYTNVRIEMYTSECIYNVDPIYAYISGDYQSMTLEAAGCADPVSDIIDTLTAPSDMISYRWYVTTSGAESNIYDSQHMDSVSFRILTGVNTDNHYTPRVSDFVLTEGPHAGDTADKQTFMCLMTSALDPAKPMRTKIYANVVLHRPLTEYYTESTCDTTVYFHDRSRCLAEGGLDIDSTYWVIYSDTTFTDVLDTLYSTDTFYHFQQLGYYGIRHHCMSAKNHCVAENLFICKPMEGDAIDYSIKTHVCNGDRVKAKCTAGCTNDMTWYVDGEEKSTGNNLDVLLPVGRHTVTLEAVSETGCTLRKDTTVLVMPRQIPHISSHNTSICIGDSTVLNVDIDGDYRWVSSPRDTSLPEGYEGTTVTVSPMERTTYTLLPTSYDPCYTEDPTIVINVRKHPVPQVMYNRPVVSVDNNTIVLTDISPDHTRTTWTFEDGSTAQGEHHAHTFGYLADIDSVCVGMESCNGPACCSDTSFCIPVHTFNIWYPNAFTPTLESNNRFAVVSNSTLVHYEIWIYNRQGLLVYASTNPAESWDGSNRYGTPCPQGAYVYHYRYATENGGPYHEGTGTVTLIR